jgi:hypothetical protein
MIEDCQVRIFYQHETTGRPKFQAMIPAARSPHIGDSAHIDLALRRQPASTAAESCYGEEP